MVSETLPRPTPRLAPGSPAEVGRINFLIARALGVMTGSGPPNLFTTLARHRRLFRPWLRFAGTLMPGGVLPRADTEILILRVAHATGCEYEWDHHQRLALTAGLSAADVLRVREGPEASEWSERQRLLLSAADELLAERALSATLWSQLRPQLSDAQLIELCMLVGHYEMLAMTINSLGVVPDTVRPEFSALMVRVTRAVSGGLERLRSRH